jgi:mono/diheme cytochrome c family protein
MCKIPNSHCRLFASVMIGALFGAYSEIASSADEARGKLLYETNCSECHTKSVSERPNRKAKSISDIRHSVVQWEKYKGYKWSGEEIDDVTQYLNNRFYKY